MSILTTEELAKVISDSKSKGLIVGLCHGCFDILHIGHIRHFTAARSQCDLLFVSVTGNKFVNKGPDRPIIPEVERAEVVSSLKVVSGAIINQYPTSIELLSAVLPNLYFKGQEYINIDDLRFLREKEHAERLGIEIRHTFEKVCSSSKIISSLRASSSSENLIP